MQSVGCPGGACVGAVVLGCGADSLAAWSLRDWPQPTHTNPLHITIQLGLTKYLFATVLNNKTHSLQKVDANPQLETFSSFLSFALDHGQRKVQLKASRWVRIHQANTSCDTGEPVAQFSDG